MSVIQYQTREEWLADRPTFLGASETPILCGQGYANQSVANLWLGKKAPTMMRDEPSISMRLGSNLQAGILKTAMEELRFDAVACDNLLVRSRDTPFIACSPDAIMSGNRPCEVKNLSWMAAKPFRRGIVPLMFQIQLQHQMYCLGASEGLLVANLANDELFHEYIPRDDELIELLVLTAQRFWRTLEADQPPPWDTPEQERIFLAKRYPESRHVYMDLPQEAAEIWDLRQAAAAREKAAESEKKAAENKIKNLMQDRAFGLLPDGRVIKWSSSFVAAHTVKECTRRAMTEVKSLPPDAELETDGDSSETPSDE